MARKPVLEGGKRDEIIAAAQKLFFTEGFEKTSVRMILDQVGGEVGMFYHYFRSKEELFDAAADSFFRGYEEAFRHLAENIRSPEEFVRQFLIQYENAMEKYRMMEGRMHWTVRSALHERTVQALIPTAAELLRRFGTETRYPADISAAKAVADISAAIHSQSFTAMNEEERRELLVRLIKENL